MGLWALVATLAIFTYNTNGEIPNHSSRGLTVPEPDNGSHQDYDYHFNMMGVHLGLMLDDASVPLHGGEIYLEFSVQAFFKLIQEDPSLFMKMSTSFKEKLYLLSSPSMLDRLSDVMTIKAVVTYKLDEGNRRIGRSSVFDTKIEYTFLHQDYTKEMGSVNFEYSLDGYQSVSLEVLSKNEQLLPNFLLLPFKIKVANKEPLQRCLEYSVNYKRSDKALDMTLSFCPPLFNVHTVYTLAEDEYTNDIVINYIDIKYNNDILISHKKNGIQLFLIDFNLHPYSHQIKGKFQASSLFSGEPIESTFVWKSSVCEFNIVRKSLEIMKIKLLFKDAYQRKAIPKASKSTKTAVRLKGNKLMAYMKIDSMEGDAYLTYDNDEKMFKITIPKGWLSDGKNLGLTVNMKPLDIHRPFLGGVFSALVKRQDVPFLKFDLDFEFVNDASKYNLHVKIARLESLDTELVKEFFSLLPISMYEFCQHYLINSFFQKGEFTGHIFYDKVNKNDLFQKFRAQGKIIMIDEEVFNVVLDTVPVSYHFSVYYPRVFQRMFNKPLEKLELDVLHVVSGADHTVKFITNYEEITSEFKSTNKFPSNFLSVNILKGELPLVMFQLENEYIDNDTKTMFSMKHSLNLHSDSFIHNKLCEVSSLTCFEEIKGDFGFKNIVVNNERIQMYRYTVDQDNEEVYKYLLSKRESDIKQPDSTGDVTFVFKCPYVVPLLMRGQTWFNWMMPVMKSPFDIIVKYSTEEKTLPLVIQTNIDTLETLVEVKPGNGDKFNIEIDNELVAEFEVSDQKIHFFRTMKDRAPLHIAFGWMGKFIDSWPFFTVWDSGLTLLVTDNNDYNTGNNDSIIAVGSEWNFEDSSQGTLKFVIGKKNDKIHEEIEVLRNFKWNVYFDKSDEVTFDQFTLAWDGHTILGNRQPVMTDARIDYFTWRGPMATIKKPFTLKISRESMKLINTRPFKFAMLLSIVQLFF